MNKNPSFISVIKNVGFSSLWTNQILVQLSYNSLNFALIIWVFKLTDSNTAVSALLFAVYLPAVLFGLLAGVFVDILDRKKIILTIDLLLAILVFSLIFFKGSYVVILAITFLINCLVQFYTPSESSAIPMIVKKDQLLPANSLFSTTLFLMFLIGFGVAGPIIDFLGINFVFIIGTISLILAFLLASSLPNLATRQDAESRRLMLGIKMRRYREVRGLIKTEIGETLKLIRGRLNVFASIIILSSTQAVIGILAVLMPSFLERILQINATSASYILITPLGVGMILGALLVGKLGHRFPRRRLVGRAILVEGLLFFLMGIFPLISPAIQHFPKPKPLPFVHQPSLSLILGLGSFLVGIALVTIIIPSQTVIAENTPEEERGKVFATLAVAMSAFSLIPVLFAGILADIFGTMPIFLGLGGIILLVGLFMLKPDFFFEDYHLPFHLREFLGLGHWEK